MLFHLFRKYPDAHFVIIADYKDEVLGEYLEPFSTVKYILVKASGIGTCGGVKQSLELIPSDTPYIIVLQGIALEIGKRMGVTLDYFRINHPGGGIGARLSGKDLW